MEEQLVELFVARVGEDEGQRQIIENYLQAEEQSRNSFNAILIVKTQTLQGVLKLLALRHAVDPDYQAGWRP